MKYDIKLFLLKLCNLCKEMSNVFKNKMLLKCTYNNK